MPGRSRVKWQHAGEIDSWAAFPPTPFASDDHGGRVLAQVRASPAASVAFERLGADTSWTDGAVLALTTSAPSSGVRGATYVMTRSAGRWEFSLVEADGTVGVPLDAALCVRCHADASSAGVFGVTLPPVESVVDAGNAR